MIIIIIGLLVLFCVVMAVFLIDSKRMAKWTASEERLSTQRPYSHEELR